MRAAKPAIVVHGGAGEWRSERQQAGLNGVKEAAQIGFEVLQQAGTSLDAVESAVKSMEDNEAFNAGLGSSLNLNKQIEMEASIMNGETLSAGAVGLVKDIRYPVQLARLVMKNTDHVFLVGQGANKLAELFGLEHRNPQTELRARYWKELNDKLKLGKLNHLPKLSELMMSSPSLFDMDTVGAVALDNDGNVAAATSTGGISLKIPGRVGDTPLMGCGNYADNESGACSATGIGEIAVRLVVAKTTCDAMKHGQSPQAAVESTINDVNRRIRNAPNQMGLIAIDPEGRIGAAHNSSHLCWAFMTPQKTDPKVSLRAKRLTA